MFFGTTDQLFTELELDLCTCKWMLFDMRRVQSLDHTAAQLFKLMQDRLQERGGEILFSGMPSSLPSRQDLQSYLIRVGLVGERGKGIRIFETRDEALEWMENRILAVAGLTKESEESILDPREIELLREVDNTTIVELRECVHEWSVPAGEKIFKHGDGGDEIFLIQRGIIRILLPLKHGKQHHLATFKRGDYFGEMAFLDKGIRSADAEAKMYCELYYRERNLIPGYIRTPF